LRISCLDIIPACDREKNGQTDIQTDRHLATAESALCIGLHAYASRGNSDKTMLASGKEQINRITKVNRLD